MDAVDFELASGEIHGLLGENGAGKTTLARIMAGIVLADAGRVELGGPVAMVHQHFSLVPRFTGLENVALFNGAAGGAGGGGGPGPRGGAWSRLGTLRTGYRARVEARAEELGLDVELDVPVGRLGVVERQRLEILKALMGEPSVLLLDEPTAVLAPQEVDGLLAVLRQVAGGGAGIVLVAHKLDEVLAAADRVTVLRRGRRVLTRKAAEMSAEALAGAMVGVAARPGGAPGGGGEVAHGLGGMTGNNRTTESQAKEPADEDAGAATPPVAALRQVVVESAGANPLRGVTLEVRRGEILGIAGVGGNGQRTLAAVLAGVREPDAGDVTLPGKVGWIPQDRAEEGLVQDFTIAENTALALHDSEAYRRGPWLDWDGVGGAAAALARDLDVRTGSYLAAREQGPGGIGGALQAPVAALSGGNQQRVVVGREFLRSRDFLVAESPTRGLDVRATRAVRDRIMGLTRERKGVGRPGVVLISADLDEILEMSHRIAVMVRGRLIPVEPRHHNAAAIGEVMLSARGDSPR